MGEKIRLAASQALAAEVTFDSLEVSFLEGLESESVQIATHPDKTTPFLSISEVLMTYNPFKLFQKQIDLKVIRLDSPEVNFIQDEDGEWNIPSGESESNEITFDSGWVTFDILLQQFILTQGTVNVSNAAGEKFFSAQGIDINGQLIRVPSGIQASGNIHVSAFQFYDMLTLEKIQSSINYENRILTLPDLTGSAYQGEATGSGQIDLGIGGPTFKLQIELTQVDFLPLFLDLKGNSGLAEGKLDLQCQLEGNLNRTNQLSGTGTLQMTEVLLAESLLVKTIAEDLKLPALTDLKVDTIDGEYKFADLTFTFYRLEGLSEFVRFTANGPVRPDRSLAIDVLLILHPELAEQMPGDHLAHFRPNSEGHYCLPFQIGGHLDEPETNLRDLLNAPLPELEPSSP